VEVAPAARARSRSRWHPFPSPGPGGRMHATWCSVRVRRQEQRASERWRGLHDNDTWQEGYLKPGSPALREIKFWVGD